MKIQKVGIFAETCKTVLVDHECSVPNRSCEIGNGATYFVRAVLLKKR